MELLPRIYEVGEVGIPLTINDGCLFETSEILQESKAIIISGFMRLKEFIKRTSDSNVNGEEEVEGGVNGEVEGEEEQS